MDRSAIFLTAAALAVIASCSKPGADVPCCVGEIAMGNSYFIDTICAVNGETYRVLDNPDYGQRLLFDNNKVLADNPLLEIDSVAGDTFRVSILLRSQLIDFASAKSLAKIREVAPHFKDFNTVRYWFDAPAGTKGAFGFTVDVPDGLKNEEGVEDWLRSMICDSTMRKADEFEILAKESADEFFDEFDREEGDTLFAYTANECYRVYECTPAYVTYLVYAYEFTGGAHGMYSTSLASYSLNDNAPVTNHFLYGDNYYEPVTRLILEAMAENEAFQAAHNVSTPAEARKSLLEDWGVSEIPLPQPALTPQGVVYCYQPYELGSYAEGAYQFVIPYDKLLGLLTPQARVVVSY